MAVLDFDLDVFPVFAALLQDGSVLLELAIGDAEHLAKVRMPPSEVSRRLAAGAVVTLDLDALLIVAPGLAGEIDEFVTELRQRLIRRVAQN